MKTLSIKQIGIMHDLIERAEEQDLKMSERINRMLQNEFNSGVELVCKNPQDWKIRKTKIIKKGGMKK